MKDTSSSLFTHAGCDCHVACTFRHACPVQSGSSCSARKQHHLARCHGESVRLHHGPGLADLLGGSVCDAAKAHAASTPSPGVGAGQYVCTTHGGGCFDWRNSRPSWIRASTPWAPWPSQCQHPLPMPKKPSYLTYWAWIPQIRQPKCFRCLMPASPLGGCLFFAAAWSGVLFLSCFGAFFCSVCRQLTPTEVQGLHRTFQQRYTAELLTPETAHAVYQLPVCYQTGPPLR